MKPQKLKIGILGCGFSHFFLPAYLAHPNVACVGLGDANPGKLAWMGDQFGISRRHANLEEMLESDYDAIHIMTPVPLHAEQTLAVLRAGKHCACAVPMATSIEDMRRIAEAQRASGRKYMMFEPNAYWDEVLYVKQLLASGGMGRLQFLRGLQHYNLNTHPRYWQGFPPMHYISHAIAPLLEIAETRAASVHCLGSGEMR
ncbi:MAG TPA: Gfo/Idh/MocA family oxidoreductase, partial [Terrimicrobiaceae bacterium]|nr:Gfo/Idh/MocA family oxidoreductase [Terrimicrobiaceae bacterium]